MSNLLSERQPEFGIQVEQLVFEEQPHSRIAEPPALLFGSVQLLVQFPNFRLKLKRRFCDHR